MRRDIIIIDNFYEDPYLVREYALKQLRDDFYLPYGSPVWKSTPTKRWDQCPFKSSQSLINRLGDITGEEVDVEAWKLDYPKDDEIGKGEGYFPNQNHPGWDGRRLKSCKWNCTFHMKPRTNQQLGEGVHNHVTDVWNSVGEDGWVGLIYLNPEAPIDSGLFLWENLNKEKNYDWMTPKENWKLIDSLGAVFNRLILCRGQKPHSGADGFSESDENGRLYQTFFFTTKNESKETFQSVQIINIH